MNSTVRASCIHTHLGAIAHGRTKSAASARLFYIFGRPMAKFYIVRREVVDIAVPLPCRNLVALICDKH